MSRNARKAVIGILVLWLAGCAATTPPATPPSPASPATSATPTSARPAAQQDPEAVRWIRNSAEFPAQARQTYLAATARVEQAATTRSRGRWGVVLDVDETILSNVQYQVERTRAGLVFTQDSWTAWVKRREAVPIAGAAAFLARVRALGGRLALVTNRYDYECDDTKAEFARHQLAYDVMLCRVSGQPSDKNPRFQSVALGTTPMGGPPLDVVAFVGDNILDFPGLSQASRQNEPALAEFGVRFFLIANPMYGSW